MSNAPLFAPRTIHDGVFPTGRRVVQVVACDQCPATHEFRTNTRSGGMSDDTVMRKARIAGWAFARRGRDRKCPACVRSGMTVLAVHKLNSEPEAMRAALTITGGRTEEQVIDAIRLEAVLNSGAPSLALLEDRIRTTGSGALLDQIPVAERITPEPKPMKPTTAAVANFPRQPSREDKRRVLDKLNEVYEGEETGYSGDWSDEKVAASLSAPPAWVRDLRIEFHGENAGNAASDKEARARRREINELKGDIDRIETRMMTALADCERAIGPVKARLAKLDGETA